MESASDEKAIYPSVVEQAIEAVLGMLQHWGPDPLTLEAHAAEAEFARFFARAVILGIQRGSFGEERCQRAISTITKEVRAAFPLVKHAVEEDEFSPGDDVLEYLAKHSYEEISARERERQREWYAQRLEPVERARMIRETVLLALLRELLEATARDFVTIQDPPPGSQF